MNLNSNDEQIQNVNEPVRPRLPSIQQLTNGHIFHRDGNPSSHRYYNTSSEKSY